jgi:hypothetical protein
MTERGFSLSYPALGRVVKIVVCEQTRRRFIETEKCNPFHSAFYFQRTHTLTPVVAKFMIEEISLETLANASSAQGIDFFLTSKD